MQLRLLKAGLLSTIQDMGRQKYLSQAVPVSGVMDTLSARIANKAVGNSTDAAVIEFTYADAAFIAETDLLIAYAGGGAVLMFEKQTIPKNRPVFIPAGTTFELLAESSGSRSYLAVAGGWEAKVHF
jgi:antagonist of KipI